MNQLIASLKKWIDFTKMAHTIFALPFVLASLVYATNAKPELLTTLKIVLAVFFARNVAMSFNRIVDRHFDAKNPRTAMRHLVQKTITHQSAWLFLLANGLLFFLICYSLNWLSFFLAPVALAIVCFYSLTKRFTHLTQIFLGIALGIAPLACWVAINQNLSPTPFILAGIVLFWVAGFDILYALQDYSFDKKAKLKSLVVALGPQNAVWMARGFHLVTFFGFLYLGYFQKHSWFFYGGVCLLGIILLWEHLLIVRFGLKKINHAFFTANGFIGIGFFVITFIELRFLNS